MRTSKFLGLLAVTVVAFFSATFLPGDAYGQGRWAERYTRADVNNIIRRLENSSDRFREDFDRAMDDSAWNGTPNEDRYNRTVKDYENAVDDLRENFDRNDSWWQSRSRVTTVVNRARPVNTMINVLPFRRNLERQWNRMRGDLNTLADTYDIGGLDGGGWTGGDGGGANRPPGWAVGTWYWNGNRERILTIEQNGRVTVNSGGNMQYGWYSNGILTIDYEQSTLSRNGNNGLRTYNRTLGETSNYSRNASGGGWDGDSGQRPPNWAVGTWYWNGGERVLTIEQNGRITVNSNGNMQYGWYRNNMLTIDNERSTITRRGDGIRTYNRATGQTSDYSKNYSGGDGDGGGAERPPNWAVGTWYWNGERARVLTISSNGQVTVNSNGNMQYGVYRDGMLIIDGERSTVTRNGNRIRTYNQTNGQSSNYSR